MSIRLPEGIYPGCTASSGIAQPGAGMWINIPGYGSSVRAIVSNKIDALTNLTLTVDSAGNARVFGIGEKPPTLERTTDFTRIRSRTAARTLIGKAAVIVRLIRFTGLYAFDVSPNIIGAINNLAHTQHWLLQSGVTPILLLEHSNFPVGAPTSRAGAGEWGMADISPLFYLSINSDDPSVVHVDLISRMGYTGTLFDLEAEAIAAPRMLRHWRVRGSEIEEVPISEAWRSAYMNSTTLNSGTLTDDPCVNAYAPIPTANIDSLYRYQIYFFSVESNPEIVDLVSSHGPPAFLVEQPANVDIVSYTLARDSTCSSNNLDADRKAFTRFEQLPIGMRSLQINSYTTPEGDIVLLADMLTFTAQAGLIWDA